MLGSHCSGLFTSARLGVAVVEFLMSWCCWCYCLGDGVAVLVLLSWVIYICCLDVGVGFAFGVLLSWYYCIGLYT